MPGSTSQNLKKRMLKSPRLERRLLSNDSNKSQEIVKQMSIEILDQNPYELGYTYEDIINFRRHQTYGQVFSVCFSQFLTDCNFVTKFDNRENFWSLYYHFQVKKNP